MGLSNDGVSGGRRCCGSSKVIVLRSRKKLSNGKNRTGYYWLDIDKEMSLFALGKRLVPASANIWASLDPAAIVSVLRHVLTVSCPPISRVRTSLFVSHGFSRRSDSLLDSAAGAASASEFSVRLEAARMAAAACLLRRRRRAFALADTILMLSNSLLYDRRAQDVDKERQCTKDLLAKLCGL